MDSSSLDLIAEEFAEAVRRGESPSVADFVARYPDAPAELHSLLTSIAMIEGLKSDSPNSIDRRSLTIDQLDDYKILREVGRGGMGIVFEAIHQSLGRRVAIKVLSSSMLGDKKHLARFRREARAAAKLRHTNIVPVFGVGESDDHHYYVMDFIDGLTLRERIESFAADRRNAWPTIDQATADTDGRIQIESAQLPPSSTASHSPIVDSDRQGDHRWAAQIGATICDALDYAHSQGVLHRDIKPANLMVDRSGRVWIADFGLAKLTEQQAMTATGDIVGTPQYMPPESFEGNYDVRSEIYAVGLTLYELLTLHPAIEGKSPADVIRKATSGVITRPTVHRPELPRDLETIVLKCLAHEPKSRYRSAGDVRDDLHRFLASRPIAARRTGLMGRAVRWSRREPVVASLTSVAFGLLLALAGVSAIGFLKTKQALDVASAAKQSAEQSLVDKSTALDSAEQQRARAEKNLQVALAGFESIMKNISDRGIDAEAEFFGEFTDTTSPNVTPEDAKLLQTLLGFFDELGTNNSEDLLAESAVAARRAGEIYQRLGKLREADRAYSEALDRYRTLARQDTNRIDFVIAQSEVLNELAEIAGLRGQPGNARVHFNQTLKLLEPSSKAMDTQMGRFQFARAHRLFASIRARSGLDSLGRKLPGRAGLNDRRRLAGQLKNRIAEERSATEIAIETLTELVKESPDETRFQVELARAYRDRAKVAGITRNKRESENSIRQSIDLFESLNRKYADSEAIRYELAVTLSSTEAFGVNPGRRTLRAEQLSRALLADSPDQPRYMALRAHTLTVLARFQAWRIQAGNIQSTGHSNVQEAIKSLDEAIQIYGALMDKSPELSLYVARSSQVMEAKADLMNRQGETNSAVAILQAAIERLQQEVNRPNPSPVAKVQLQRLQQKLERWKDST